MNMDILFVIPPEDKYLCCNHGGLMSTPIVNVECGHMFCESCIETLGNCPIDNEPINTLDINFQVKNDIDQLLCYCKFGVMEVEGQLFVNEDGCSSIINLASKKNHEASCRYNPNKSQQTTSSSTSSDDEFVFFDKPIRLDDSPTFSSPSYQSIQSSPFTKLSPPGSLNSSPTTKTKSRLVMSGGSPFSSSSSSSNENDSPISIVSSKSIITCTSLPTKFSLNESVPDNQFNQSKQHSPSISTSTSTTSTTSNSLSSYTSDFNNDQGNNPLWESSTQLFFCSRYCPNKEYGCYFYGKTEDNIKYHLEHECSAQRMKRRITQLESSLESKDKEINNLRSSIQLQQHQYTQNQQIYSYQHDTFSSLIQHLLKSIRKSIVRGIKSIKRIFRGHSYKKLN